MSASISVLIPTRNEEKNIRKCINSVAWADEIWVVDSHSSDRTVEIAGSLGARVVQFRWDGMGPRKLNWSLANIPFRHEWLLVVDADEEPSPELRNEITTRVLGGTGSHAGYLIPYDYWFLGRLLKHGDRLWKLVLFKVAGTRYERRELPGMEHYDLEMHCHPIVNGTIGRLSSTMIHRDVDNLDHYFERHNIYSQWEALLRARHGKRNQQGEIPPRLFGSACSAGAFLSNCFFQRQENRSFTSFIPSIVRGGFLDGRPGFIYNLLKAMYWYQISVKEYEIRHSKKAVESMG